MAGFDSTTDTRASRFCRCPRKSVPFIGVALGVPILDPIIGIAITIAILLIVKNAAISLWTRLIDGIEPKILAEIEHAPTHITGVRAVRDVRARWIGHRVYSDLAIEVDPKLSVGEGMC